ncbi:MAG TPA: MarP family serine protease [Acidimicrobiales bacterium]|nr:MarP family serine protease [Acidimicrobiales bacterium]
MITASAVGAAVGGYRLGLLARVTSWIGMGVGFVIGARVLPPILRAVEDGSDQQLLFVTLGVLLGCAFIGQALGLWIGGRMHVALPGASVRSADRAAGAGAGVVGVVVSLWLLLPVLADVRGWVAVQARTSTIAELVHENLPDAPDALATLRRLVGGDQFPRVFDALQPAPDLGPPPTAAGIPQPVVDAVVLSTVKVEGVACQRIQDGSGFVAAPELVVTNAHVVAGEDETTVQRSDGSEVAATVVAFDPRRDIAVLRAPGLNRAALPLAEVEVGGTGAVFGHPGGGPLRVAPFSVGRKVTATGTDIYDQERTEREVLILSSSLAPGDSGAGLVDPQGRVVGVAFAIAPDKPDVAYALDITELKAVLAGPLSQEVDTGACLR